MKYFALYHHSISFQEIGESELFNLLSELGMVTPSIMKLIGGQTVTTPKAQIYGIHTDSH